jgi:hypothetical protein
MKNSPKNKKSSAPSSVFTIMVMVVAITMLGLVLTDAMGLGSTVKENLSVYLGGSAEPVTTTYSHPLMGGQPIPAENDGDCLACHKSLP